MSFATEFLAAYFGAFTGIMTALIPVGWIVKKKFEESGIGALF